MDKDVLSVNARGGIIRTGVRVHSSSFSEERGQGRGSGHAILTIPTEPTFSIYGYHDGRPKIFSGDDVREKELTFAHIINHEWENASTDPDKDFWDASRLPLLIGRKAIYNSEYFTRGVSELLLAIETAVSADRLEPAS